jgi:hypothetical protein
VSNEELTTAVLADSHTAVPTSTHKDLLVAWQVSLADRVWCMRMDAACVTLPVWSVVGQCRGRHRCEAMPGVMMWGRAISSICHRQAADLVFLPRRCPSGRMRHA